MSCHRAPPAAPRFRVQVGHRVLIDDGKMIVVVREKSADNDWVKVEVMNDAFLSSRKGFNLPDT